MQKITTLPTLLIIAFAITCSVFLLMQSSPPIFFPYLGNSIDIALVSQNINPANKMVNAVPDTNVAQAPTSITNQIEIPTSIWANIGEQLKLDHHSQNPRVQIEIRKLLSDKKSFEAILNRSAPYIYYIYTQTQQRHLPAELALVPIIESEYNANNHNSIGAMGLWQLMPGTARGLGVNMSNGYDGRRNVVDSTNAALTFLNDLGKQFNGNWNLAFAAYNCGPGCVSSAVKRANSHDYFNLRLPLETKIYVPRLLAIAAIIKHAKEYGIVLPPITDAPYFKEVKVNSSESLSSYAKSTGTDLDVLKKLNPDYQYEKAQAFSKTILVPVKSRAI